MILSYSITPREGAPHIVGLARSGGHHEKARRVASQPHAANCLELTTVRDHLRHASVATTSIYLHSYEVKRALRIREAFSRPK
jgi:hypothetical protein